MKNQNQHEEQLDFSSPPILHNKNNKLSNEQQNPQFQKYQSHKLNQHLLSQTSFFLLLLAIVSILNNGTKSYDYNIVIAGGIYFLATVNPVLYKQVYFYIMVLLTIVADGTVIGLLVGKVNVMHSVVFPSLEIILKVLVIVFEGLRWVKEVNQVKYDEEKGLTKEQVKKMKQNKTSLSKQQQQLALKQKEYLQSKKPKVLDRSTYYNPITLTNSVKNSQNYTSPQFKQFYNMQYVNEQRSTQRPKKN